ncbi:MAG: hypothetical protein IPK26_01500 [Planctomycetes bacterium]|nr:hypothetical protein [Planctomycetota bacterium]
MNALQTLKLLSATLTLTGLTLAQNLVTPTIAARVGSFTRNVGNSEAGVNVAMNGRVESRVATISATQLARQYRAEGSALGRVSIWGTTRDAAFVSGFAQVRNGSWATVGNQIDRNTFVLGGRYNAGYTVRLGSQTMFAPTFSGSADITITRNQNFNIPTFLSVERVHWVTVIPITVRVQAGADASLNMSATLRPVDLSATLSGTGRGRAFGRASASLGVGCIQLAGIQADLRLLDTTMNLTFNARLVGGLSGSFTYSMTAVRFLLSLFGDLCIGSWSLPIWNLTFGSVSGSRTLV